MLSPLKNQIAFYRRPSLAVLMMASGLSMAACSSSSSADPEPAVSNDPPSFSTGNQNIAIDENDTAVGTVSATDPNGDSVTYSLSGSDADLFLIDPMTGALRYDVAPDFENPRDANGDNTYEFSVTATDPLGGSSSIQYSVNVMNLTETRYLNQIFTGTEITPDIIYASVDGRDLVLNVVTPEGDAETGRPFMLWATGGAFAFTDRTLSLPLAEGYARAGYVTAVMDYRTAGEFVEGEAFQNAAVDGAHDMMAAVRFMRANAETYGIDPDRIIVAGTSAAGFMSATLATIDPNDPLTESLQDYLDTVGGVYGEVGDHLDQSSEVQGALPISGAIFGLDTIDLNSAPIYGAHNELDSVAPCGTVVSEDGERTISGTCDFIPAFQVLGLPAEALIVPDDTGHVEFSDAEWAQIRNEALAFFYENVINAD